MNDLEMGKKNCYICAGQAELYAGNFYFFKEWYDLFKCKKCGVVFVCPQPSAENIKSMYGTNYFEKDYACGFFDVDHENSKDERIEEYNIILDLAQKYVHGSKDLFEIGCGCGSLLEYARKEGWDVRGIEISEYAASKAKDILGETRVDSADFLELKEYEQSGVVILIDVLEHMRAPLKALRKLKEIMDDRSVFILKVPTYVNSFWFKVVRKLDVFLRKTVKNVTLREILKIGDRDLAKPYHLFEYSRKTLRRLLEAEGFEILKMQNFMPVPSFLSAEDRSFADKILWMIWQAAKYVSEKLGIFSLSLFVVGRKNQPEEDVDRR